MNVKGGGASDGTEWWDILLESSMKRLTIKINQSKFIRQQLHCPSERRVFLLETQVCTIKTPKRGNEKPNQPKSDPRNYDPSNEGKKLSKDKPKPLETRV